MSSLERAIVLTRLGWHTWAWLRLLREFPLPDRPIMPAMRARHDLVVSLWMQGLSLQRCADVAGLKNASGARHHINRKCRCEQ